MATDLKKFAEQLVGLTVLEVNELKTILKDEYNIEPAAAAVAVAGPAAGGDHARHPAHHGPGRPVRREGDGRRDPPPGFRKPRAGRHRRGRARRGSARRRGGDFHGHETSPK